MLLIGVQEQDKWLLSLWQLTYSVGWAGVKNAVHRAYPYFEDTEILADYYRVKVRNRNAIHDIDEAGSLTIRGICTALGVPMMMTFWNQTRDVEVMIPLDNGEFRAADYEAFNKSLSQFLDSLELSLYLPEKHGK